LRHHAVQPAGGVRALWPRRRRPAGRAADHRAALRRAARARARQDRTGDEPDRLGAHGRRLRMTPDRFGAFCTNEVRLAGAAGGPLAGLTFAAKDLFDIAGHVTGAGNPDWLASPPPA